MKKSIFDFLSLRKNQVIQLDTGKPRSQELRGASLG